MKLNRVYEKRGPQVTAKQFFIFCEGEKRETLYFHFFNRIASQIILQIVPIANGRNSPMGLYNNACKAFTPTAAKPEPEYWQNPGDEVWFIIDTDAWAAHIPALRTAVANHAGWHVVQSNPCFEVWLYHHFHDDKPEAAVENWKEFVNSVVPGGFNCTKHPQHIERATVAAAAVYSETAGIPDSTTTQMFRLAEQFIPFVAEKLRQLSFGKDVLNP